MHVFIGILYNTRTQGNGSLIILEEAYILHLFSCIKSLLSILWAQEAHLGKGDVTTHKINKCLIFSWQSSVRNVIEIELLAQALNSENVSLLMAGTLVRGRSGPFRLCSFPVPMQNKKSVPKAYVSVMQGGTQLSSIFLKHLKGK